MPKLIAFTGQHIVYTIRKSGPRIVHAGGLRFGYFTDLKFDNTVVWEIAAVEPHRICTVGFVSHPDKSVCTDTEKFGSVIVAVLDAKAEP